jgi:hypothetical protein
MSLDMMKSAGTITAQVLKVSHHGFVAARQRKMKRVRSPESIGTTLKTRGDAAGESPAWATQAHVSVPAELIADIQVWRAATQVEPSDLRPTGPPQPGNAARLLQHQLDK